MPRMTTKPGPETGVVRDASTLGNRDMAELKAMIERQNKLLDALLGSLGKGLARASDTAGKRHDKMMDIIRNRMDLLESKTDQVLDGRINDRKILNEIAMMLVEPKVPFIVQKFHAFVWWCKRAKTVEESRAITRWALVAVAVVWAFCIGHIWR